MRIKNEFLKIMTFNIYVPAKEIRKKRMVSFMRSRQKLVNSYQGIIL